MKNKSIYLWIVTAVLLIGCSPKNGVPGIPDEKPADWDAIQFNYQRGIYGGAIPKSYHKDITSKDGEKNHLGKHLPYVPALTRGRVPAGFLPIMFGNPALGYTPHPNAPRSASDPDGHWYTWIKVRKSTPAVAKEMTTNFDDWPTPSGKVNGKIIAYQGEDPSADKGKNTVYLVQLPEDVRPGDTVRVWGYCLNHGEYLDFVRIPEK